MSVTQELIAKKLGLSRTAVGFALRGDGHVGEETRRLILDTAREMGYTAGTNREARLLAARRNKTRVPTGIVAVVSAVGIEAHFERISAYHGPFMVGMELAALEHEIALLVCSIMAQRVPAVLRDGWVDGIICTENNLQVTEIIVRNSLRCVYVGVTSSADSLGDSILPDEYGGFTQLMDHLLELGHRTVGFVSLAFQSANAVTRYSACVDAMKRRGLDPDKHLPVVKLYGMHHGQVAQSIADLLESRPDVTALLCYNDWIAMEAVRTLDGMGRSVPGDISVVGFDDTSFEHRFSPELTTVRTPRIMMGSRAVELLVQPPHDPITEVVPVEFIARGSSGPVRAG